MIFCAGIGDVNCLTVCIYSSEYLSLHFLAMGTLEQSERNTRRLGKEQAGALRMVADVTGKHIVVLDQIDAGGRKDVANGKYQNGVIYISAKTQTLVFDVLKHELTHNLQETAPARALIKYWEKYK